MNKMPGTRMESDILKHMTDSSVKYNGSSNFSKMPQMRHIWVVIGPAGCGKTTVATHLANTLCLPYLEGDTFHPPANIKKMSHGEPLSDSDRWDWLIKLRELCLNELAEGAAGVVLTCSALKAKYRDVIRIASYHHSDIDVHFVYLKASEQILISRVRSRKGHYMKDDMVHSQFLALEEPTPEEMDCLIIDVIGTPIEVNDLVLGEVQAALAKVAKVVQSSAT